MRKIFLAWAGMIVLGLVSAAVNAGLPTPPGIVLDVDPVQAAFGNQPVGTESQEMTITISNPLVDLNAVVNAATNGTGAVQITSVAAGGPDAGAFPVVDGCADTMLYPGDSCQVKAKFAPDELSDASADLVVDCTALAGVGVSSIICQAANGTQVQAVSTIPDYFTGKGVPAAIPTLGQWGVTLLALLLAVFMTTRLRKQANG